MQKALETTDDPDRVEMRLKRKYFLVMGRKMWIGINLSVVFNSNE